VYAINEKTIIDGNVMFDRASDPDDMRLMVDPNEEVPETMIRYWEDDMHQCMQNTKWLFGAEAGSLSY
jgi:hypothetical protein